MSVPELSIQLRNIPGQISQVTAVIAEAGINIRGIAASSAGKVGWLRVLVDDAKVAAEALEECGVPVEVGEALALEVSHDPGALDRAIRLLSDERVNIDYIYTAVAGSSQAAVMILGVQSPSKAEKLLREHNIRALDLD